MENTDRKKRSRGKKWFDSETELLLHSAFDRKHLISVRHAGPSGTNQQRLSAWQEITDIVNRSFLKERTLKQTYDKVRHYCSDAKLTYGDLEKEYGKTGAGGVDPARDRMSELEKLALDIQGVVSVQGLDVQPSVTVEAILSKSNVTYNPPKSIDNQVLEGERSNGDSNEDQEDENNNNNSPVEKSSQPINVVPSAARYRRLRNKKNNDEQQQTYNMPVNYVADNSTKKKLRKVPPPNNPPNNPPLAKNSTRANNVILAEMLEKQGEMDKKLDRILSIIDPDYANEIPVLNIPDPLQNIPSFGHSQVLTDDECQEIYPVQQSKRKESEEATGNDDIDLAIINPPKRRKRSSVRQETVAELAKEKNTGIEEGNVTSKKVVKKRVSISKKVAETPQINVENEKKNSKKKTPSKKDVEPQKTLIDVDSCPKAKEGERQFTLKQLKSALKGICDVNLYIQ